MSAPSNRARAVWAFLRRRAFRSKYERGYSSTGDHVLLNGSQIAVWSEGRPQMFHDNEPQWIGITYILAHRGVKADLEAAQALPDGPLGRVRCYAHDDCREHPELGFACIESGGVKAAS